MYKLLLLDQLVERGGNDDEIAKLREELGFKEPKPNRKEYKFCPLKYVELADQGYNDLQIAEIMNIRNTTISRGKTRHGLKGYNRPGNRNKV